MHIIILQGLLETRVELRPLLFSSHERLKDLIFLDIALDSTVRTAVERAYEELNSADPQVALFCNVLSFNFLSSILMKQTVNLIIYCFLF
jgi:alpha-glucan, water dikinase